MDKKEYLIAFALGIFVFFLVYFSYKPPIEDTTNQFVPVTADDFCRKITDSWEMKRCLAIVNAESETYCEGAYPDIMKGPCYIDFAVARNNPDICEKAGESRDSCYRSIVLEGGDETLCEKVSDASNAKDLCYKDLAQTSSDYSHCEKIRDETIKTQCKSEADAIYCINKSSGYCIMNAAIVSKTPETCSNISDTGVRSRCVMLSSASGEQCSRITHQDTRDLCYIAVAEKTKNERLCGGVAGETRRDECYLYVAKASNDPGLCELISPSARDASNSKKNYCYYHLGIINKDAGVCNIVRQNSLTTRQSDLCYYHAALRIEDMDRIKSYSLM